MTTADGSSRRRGRRAAQQQQQARVHAGQAVHSDRRAAARVASHRRIKTAVCGRLEGRVFAVELVGGFGIAAVRCHATSARTAQLFAPLGCRHRMARTVHWKAPRQKLASCQRTLHEQRPRLRKGPAAGRPGRQWRRSPACVPSGRCPEPAKFTWHHSDTHNCVQPISHILAMPNKIGIQHLDARVATATEAGAPASRAEDALRAQDRGAASAAHPTTASSAAARAAGGEDRDVRRSEGAAQAHCAKLSSTHNQARRSAHGGHQQADTA